MRIRQEPRTAPIVGFVLVIMYVFAICFERVIQIEILKPYRVIGFLMIAFALVQGVQWKDRIFVYGLALLVAGTIPAVLTLLGPDGNASYFLNQAAIYTFHLFTYIAIVSILKSERDVLIVMGFHAAGMVLSMFQLLTESQATRFAGTIARVGADFKNPAYACASLMVGYCMAVLVARRFLSRLGQFGSIAGQVTMGAVLLAMLYATTLTGSRAGSAAFVLGIVVFLMYLFWRGKNKLVPILIGASVIFLVVGFTQFAESLSSSESNVLALRLKNKQVSEDSRIGLWRAGLDAGIDAFGMGIGIGQYMAIHKSYYPPYAHYNPKLLELDMSLHNEFLTMFTEYGLMGLVIYLLLLAEIVRRARMLKNEAYKAFAYATLAAYLLLAWAHGALVHFTAWAYIALIVVLARAEFEAKA